LTCCLHVSSESLTPKASPKRRQSPRGTPSLARGWSWPGGSSSAVGPALEYHTTADRSSGPGTIHRHRAKPLQNLPSAMLRRSVVAGGQSPRNGLCSVQMPMQVPICTTAHQSKHCRRRRRCAVMLRAETAAMPSRQGCKSFTLDGRACAEAHGASLLNWPSTGCDSCLGCASRPRENTTHSAALFDGRICMRPPTHCFTST
jgi:hypothetical protein